jgi:hypothetical protein
MGPGPKLNNSTYSEVTLQPLEGQLRYSLITTLPCAFPANGKSDSREIIIAEAVSFLAVNL